MYGKHSALASQVLSPPQEESHPRNGGLIAQAGGAKRLPVFLKADEVAALLAAIPSLRDLLIMRLLYFSALRVSEVLGLELGDVDFEDHIIHVCHAVTPSGRPKNASEGLVPVDAETLRLIMQYAHIVCQDLLFDITARQVQRLIKAYARNAGIQGWERVTPHKLRHSFSVNWIKSGGDIERLRRILRHTSLARTQIYLQFRLEDVQEEYDRIMGSPAKLGHLPDYY